MPAQAELVGPLFAGAVLLVLVALIYWIHRRKRTSAKMAFLLALIEEVTTEFVDDVEKL